ncbi:helix-turn-helix domain-containing protein [Steroidobacter cummioxidans]|uniref:helix-turn-helix domain-containing protein n=1 Tax=Steroidobacter cummioxidans TaxID=1803913 RepID=UPI000E318C06|nr:AraC family transcriptional regulator [Steroidobacter cummioxidans]
MNAQICKSLPENMLDASSSHREWNGLALDVTKFRCAGRVIHKLSHDGDPKLSVVLEEIGDVEPRLREDQPCPVGYIPKHMVYIPPGMEVWGFGADVRYVKDAMLTFDIAELSERMATNFDASIVSTPRLRFAEDNLWTLVKLLAETVDDPDPSVQLYGDGLATAIAARLFSRPMEEASRAKPLAPWQLRRVFEYLDAQLPRPVALADLAVLSGLSQWHFSRAFKASTGVAPYRWQLEKRIRCAQHLLLDTGASLETVAEATGFADAVHMGRTFRKIVGATPAAWRNAHKV